MSLASQKIDTYNIPELGVTIERHFVQNSPDSVGDLRTWVSAVWDLFYRIPFYSLWKGTLIRIFDMKSPELDEMIARGEANLKDYDPNTSGNQTAAGLYYGGDSKRLDIGVWTDSIYKDSTPVDWSSKVLSHEFGHLYHDLCQINDGHDANTIEAYLSGWFEDNRPRQTENISEDFAETYRAVLGIESTRGFFSDNKPYDYPQSMYTFLKTAYALSGYLKNKRISNISIHNNYVQYRETKQLFWYTWDEWYAYTTSFRLYKWKNGGWEFVSDQSLV